MKIVSNDISITYPSIEESKIWAVLETIPDPEIPVLSIIDLGIVREVDLNSGIPTITITPTYSGCPAMDMISMQIRLELSSMGYKRIILQNQLSPAWTTDWMTETGKKKLWAYGIAAPETSERVKKLEARGQNPLIQCPQCSSMNTKLLSQFGSTACKALYQCRDCKEPFDYFKCH